MTQETTMEMAEDVTETETHTLARRIIESLLFSSSEPVPLRRIKEILQTVRPYSTTEVKELIEALRDEYEEQNRAFQVEEIAKGFLLRTCADFHPYIQMLLKNSRPDKLSHAALEVLAIIAYRQPITRPQIDDIRGIDSSGIVHTLLDRQLIEQSGKLEVPGRPTLYTVTSHFLQHFGLKDRKDLPKFPYERPINEEQPEADQEASLCPQPLQ